MNSPSYRTVDPISLHAVILLATLLISGMIPAAVAQPDIPPLNVVPSPKQIAYQSMELVGFIHFNMNTFTGKEWGFGDEDPSLFNPTAVDVEQWVRAAKTAGMKELILTTKHHDGFCLWPSKYTEHSIKNSPYKGGKGDIVREFTDACRKSGLKAGLYLSPWDRNHPAYGKPEYIAYYENQLRELLTNYGEISEVWFDGANGGDGWYGGAKEMRRINPAVYYPWKEFQRIVSSLQPNAVIFSDAGPDLRWIGNENGRAGDPCWSTITADTIVIGKANPKYLNSGDPNGSRWVVGICDVSIRPGWFYHAQEDSLVKSPRSLVDLYYESVGRNAVLLLNLPPDPRGRINPRDIDTLAKFHSILAESFRTDLALHGNVNASSVDPDHQAANLTDGNDVTYWAAAPGERSVTLDIGLGEMCEFDRILLREPIRLGQRISSFEVLVPDAHGWKVIAKGTTIGNKRIMRIPLVQAEKIRLLITGAIARPALSGVEVFRSSLQE